jgi:hypothetical protein
MAADTTSPFLDWRRGVDRARVRSTGRHCELRRVQPYIACSTFSGTSVDAGAAPVSSWTLSFSFNSLI